MGQRLVIHFYDNSSSKEFANCYYHWSGYCDAAAEILTDIAKRLDNPIIKAMIKNNKLSKYEKVMLLLDSGEGALEHDINNAQKEFNYVNSKIDDAKQKIVFMKDIQDRNVGYINFLPENIESATRWSEGDVEINIDTLDCDFGLIYESDEHSSDQDNKEYDKKIIKLSLTEEELTTFNLCDPNIFVILRTLFSLSSGLIGETKDGIYIQGY